MRLIFVFSNYRTDAVNGICTRLFLNVVGIGNEIVSWWKPESSWLVRRQMASHNRMRGVHFLLNIFTILRFLSEEKMILVAFSFLLFVFISLDIFHFSIVKPTSISHHLFLPFVLKDNRELSKVKENSYIF